MKVNFYAGALVIASMLSQNLAVAYDSSKFNTLGPDTQRVRSLIRDRISNMGEHAKLKLSYRLYKAAFKALPKLEKLSDAEYNHRFQASVSQKPEAISALAISDEGTLSQDDLNGILPDAAEIQSLSPATSAAIPSMIVKHADFTQSVRNILEQIGFNEDNHGKRKPLTQSQFNERVQRFGSTAKQKQTRTIASGFLGIDTTLEFLLSIAIICAALGLILFAIFGWVGAAIALGCLVIGWTLYNVIYNYVACLMSLCKKSQDFDPNGAMRA